jgi:hypothetical protein
MPLLERYANAMGLPVALLDEHEAVIAALEQKVG